MEKDTKINNKYYEEIMRMLDEITAIPGKWYLGSETMLITRLFQYECVMLYKLWRYDRVCDRDELRGEEADRILRGFEEAFNARDIKWELAESKSEFNVSKDKARYLFKSSIRLIPKGIRLVMRFPSNNR